MVNWTQTLATAGIGGLLALFGTGLTLFYTARRDLRAYYRTQKEARIQRFRDEYLSALMALGSGMQGTMETANLGVQSAGEITTTMHREEMYNASLRLSLLPAPDTILGLYYQASNAQLQLSIALEHDVSASELQETVRITDQLVSAMTQHLAALEMDLGIPHSEGLISRPNTGKGKR